jgi:hypothetical protein
MTTLISDRDSRMASEAALLAYTGARILGGRDRCDPETQLHRVTAIDNLRTALAILERLGPPLETQPYRDRVANMAGLEDVATWTGGDAA